MFRAKSLLTATLSTGLVIACTAPDFEGDRIKSKRGTSPASTSGAASCAGAAALTPHDPNDFPKCACAEGGKARCVPKDEVPGVVAAQLETCSDGGPGVCVPDGLVASGGATPKTCTSAFGEGRCMSLCVPEVAKNAKLLQRGEGDVCAEDERCVPCNNPLKGGASTGVCEIGKPPPEECEDAPGADGTGSNAPAVTCPYTGPAVVDVTTFPACGDGARCVPASLVPGPAASKLKTCPSGLCAPEKSIAAGGQHLPKTCTSVANAEGRCLNVNIPEVEKQGASLPQGICDANERCTPCFNPIDGKDTGACKTVSCDAPKEPPKKLADCCIDDGVARGKCVPKVMVPAGRQSKLDDDDDNCVAGAELCAPNENLDPAFQAPPCTADNFFQGQYSGVCISNCIKLSFIEALGTSRGNCKKGFTCAPCEQNGKPTGAPGCPGAP